MVLAIDNLVALMVTLVSIVAWEVAAWSAVVRPAAILDQASAESSMESSGRVTPAGSDCLPASASMEYGLTSDCLEPADA